jgi:glucose/arabinose dehydrogenase
MSRRRSALPALAAGLLTALVASCAVGPAANRADQLGLDTGTRQPTQNAVPQPLDDDASRRDSAPPPPRPEPAPAEGSVTITREIDLPGRPTDPCCLAVLPGGDLLVGERGSGAVYRVDADAGTAAPIGAIAGVAFNEGDAYQLIDLAVPENVAADDLEVYAYYTQSDHAEVARHSYDPAAPSWETPLSQAPWTIADVDLPPPSGGALAFGADGLVYVASGSDVLRMEDDGEAPDTNPTSDSLLYAHGHGDVIGLAGDAADRAWALTADGTVHAVVPGAPAGTAPVLADIGTGTALTFGSGSLWVGNSTEDGVWRLPLDGAELVAAPELIRLDAPLVNLAPAGTAGLWALTADGRILRADII